MGAAEVRGPRGQEETRAAEYADCATRKTRAAEYGESPRQEGGCELSGLRGRGVRVPAAEYADRADKKGPRHAETRATKAAANYRGIRGRGVRMRAAEYAYRADKEETRAAEAAETRATKAAANYRGIRGRGVRLRAAEYADCADKKKREPRSTGKARGKKSAASYLACGGAEYECRSRKRAARRARPQIAAYGAAEYANSDRRLRGIRRQIERAAEYADRTQPTITPGAQGCGTRR